MMITGYGTARVIEPEFVLPTSAWKLDNSEIIATDELKVEIEKIHIERTGFKAICLDANYDRERIKKRILDIVAKRGKFHNPVTDTAGLFSGKIAEIGVDYPNEKEFYVGEEVICNASMASVPIVIRDIKSIDMSYGQIDVSGYAILYKGLPLIKRPKNIPLSLLMFTLNESGTLYRVSNESVGKKKFLVLGNNLLSNLLFGMAIRNVAQEDCEVLCLLDKKTDVVIRGKAIDEISNKIFTEIKTVDILKPLESLSEIEEYLPVDLSVNCADIPGAETINILGTKPGGTVIFANLINNYNISLYITESISKQLEIRSADGYMEAYEKFDMELVERLAKYTEISRREDAKHIEDASYTAEKDMQIATEFMEEDGLPKFLISKSRTMTNAVRELILASKYDCNILIRGERGVGKERAAEAIHRSGVRRMQPFIQVDCEGIPAEATESILFGHESGEGKQLKIRKGALEKADNGTLFLREIETLSSEIQAKLLRAIINREFYRPGGVEPVKVNVRIISSTCEIPAGEKRTGKIRRDLEYKLGVVSVTIPPIRERKNDIESLIRISLEELGDELGISRSIHDDAVKYLREYSFPGNLNELETLMKRLMLSSKTGRITLMEVMEILHANIFEAWGNDSKNLGGNLKRQQSLTTMVEGFEKSILKEACAKYGSTRKTARAIGISQTQLVRKKKKYGIK